MPSFRGRSTIYLFQIFNSLSFWVILGPPIVLITTWIGGGSEAVGIVTSIMPFLTIFQIPSTRYIERLGYRRVMLTGWTGRTIMLLGIVILPFLKDDWPASKLVALLIFCIFAWSFLRGLTNASWMPWIRSLVPREQRGRFFAGQHIFIRTTSLLILFLSGVILGKNPTAMRFSLIYAISFCSAMISIQFLARVPSVDIAHEEKVHIPVFKAIRNILKQVNYRRFLYFAFCWTFANKSFDAFSVLYLKTQANFLDRDILWLSAIGSGAMIFILIIAGRLLDRWGSRPIMHLCMGGTIVYLAIWFLLAQEVIGAFFVLMVVLYIIFGIMRATVWIGISRLTLFSVPRENSIMALAIYTTGIGLSAGTSPLLWGFILERVHGGIITPYGYFFLTSVILNILAIAFLRRVEEKKAEPTMYVALELLTQPMRSLVQLMSYFPRSQHSRQDHTIYSEAAETKARKSDN